MQKFSILIVTIFAVTTISTQTTLSVDRSRRALPNSKYYCPSSSNCVHVSSCPVLQDIMKNDCVLTNRVSSLSCGYHGSGLVCCPQTSETTSVQHNKGSDGLLCGQTAVQGQDYEGIGSHPWVVRIGFKNTINGETKFPCTGSIINKRVILTAAHCALAKAENYKLSTVRVGEWATNSDIDCGDEFCALPSQDIGISHVIVHPGYEKQTYRNNIALIVLRTPINYTVSAQPICLPETWSVTGNNGVLVGWGKAAGQNEVPFHQQALHLPIVSLQICSNVYGKTIPISEEQVCAGGELGNDACSGFGGAPLLVQHSGHYYQVGILSFGSDQCGAQGIPSVYTNIKSHITWIKENTPVIYNN